MATGRMAGRTLFLLTTTILGVATTYGASTAIGFAQTAEQAFQFNIAAKPVRQAVNEIGRTAGLAVVFNETPAASIRGSGVRGVMTPSQAMSTLLRGTGLSYKFTNKNTVTIFSSQQTGAEINADGSIQLQTITIEAQGQGAITEGSRSYTTGQMNTAMKLPLSIRETPQTVSVVTQQQMKDKSYDTLDKALQDAPGVTAAQGFGDTRWEYFARGDAISNIQYDGVASPINNFTRDVLVQDNLAIYDHVEIIRGATGLTEGSGNPSASVNLVRKRPTTTPQYSLEASGSTFGKGRGIFDASGALTDAGSLRGRFVAAGGLGDGYRDYFSQNNLTLYGVIDADITENTTLSLGYSYQKEDTDGYTWGGLPTKADGSFYDFSPKTYMGSDWEYLKKKQHTVYLDAEHRFENDWKLNASARGIWADADMLTSFTWRVGNDVRKNDRLYDYDDDQFSGDVHASGPVELFGREHDVVFGASAMREKHAYVGGSSPFYVIDPENWDPVSVPKPDIKLGSFSGNLDQREAGIYASTRLNIADPFKVILGGRVSWYKNNDMYSDDEYSTNGKFIPYVGAVYDLNDVLSVYGSYTGIFKPQMAYGLNGKLLDPVYGDNKEIGLKGEFFDSRLNASASIFETNQKGLAVALADISYCNPLSYTCYEAADKIRTRGVDLEIRGEVLDNLNVGFGYTYSQSKHVEGKNSGDKYNTNKIPAHLFKLTAAYQLPNELEHWTVGGSIRAQSKTYYQGANFRIEQPAYAVVDVMTKYQLSEQTELQLNVNNLFDKQYYSSLSSLTSYGNFIGASREVVFTMRHKF